MGMISIIIPVYEKNEFLKRSIDSILAQTLKDIELWIVDDGSDFHNTHENEYEQLDKRVHFIDCKINGISNACNAGIFAAKGEFLYFPDPGAWLEPDYLQILYNIAYETKTQLVVAGYTIEYDKKGKDQAYGISVTSQLYNSKELLRYNIQNFIENGMMTILGNKLYNTEYVRSHNLRFSDLSGANLYFNMDVIKDIESIAISSSFGYHVYCYRNLGDSKPIDRTFYQRWKNQFNYVLKIYSYWQIYDREILSILYGYYAEGISKYIQEVLASNIENKKMLVKDILSDQLTCVAFKRGKFQTKDFYIVAAFVNLGSVNGCLFVEKILSIIKKNNPISLVFKICSQ